MNRSTPRISTARESMSHHERWLSLVVDDTREAGVKLGFGNQLYLAEFRWPPIEQKQQQNDKGTKEA